MKNSHDASGMSLPLDDSQQLKVFLERLPYLLAEGKSIADIVSLNATQLEAVYAQAWEMYEQQQYKDALLLFGFLTFAQHSEPRYLQARAACEQVLERFDDALQSYALLLTMNMDDAMTVFRMAECLLGQGKRDFARQTLIVVLELSAGESAEERALHRKATALQTLLNTVEIV